MPQYRLKGTTYPTLYKSSMLDRESFKRLHLRSHQKAQSLWEEALKRISPEDAAAITHSEILKQASEGKRAILSQLLASVEIKKAEWEDKRWRYRRKGEVVIVMDV
jgi:hypothetical protein